MDLTPATNSPTVPSAPSSFWPTLWVSVCARVSHYSAYPKGWFLQLVGSIFAPAIGFLLSASVVGLAALADSGLLKNIVEAAPPRYEGAVETGYLALAIVLFMVSEAFRGAVRGTQLKAYASTFQSIGSLVGALASANGEAILGRPKITERPRDAIAFLLTKAKEMVAASVNIPIGTELTATLLLPQPSGSDPDTLVLFASFDEQPLVFRKHQIVPLDAPGAGEAFSSGRAVAVRSCDEQQHPRVRDRSYKSIAAFPIWVGETREGGRVVAVLTIDSTKPYTFSSSIVRKMEPFLAPVAQLIGLTLSLSEKRGGR